jgi:hypothetical protein
MFARPGRRAFVCFGCQTRTEEQFARARWLPASDRSQRPFQRRWQSAALALAEDVPDHDDDNGHPRPRPHSKKKFKPERIWTPKPTAQLGVSFLGKPAEVLLLNERDRSIPEAPTDSAGSEEVREGNVLAAVWSTEAQSLSAEQLRKNIEQIRDEAKQIPDQDPTGRRGKLRKRLYEGFSTKQLRSYLEQKQSEASKPWRWKRQGPAVKIQMARYIFKHIWGLHGSDITDATAAVEVEKSRQVRMAPNALEVLLLAGNSSLKRIAEDHKVKIDFFRQPNKILVSGPSSSVDAARESLLHWQKRLVKHNLDLGARVEVGDAEHVSVLLSEIRQLHNVHVVGFVGIAGRKQALQLYYHEDTPPDLVAIRRHILLAHRQHPLSLHCTAWPRMSSQNAQQVFVGQPGIYSKGAENNGKRLVASPKQYASPSIPQMSDKQKFSFSEIYKANREALNFTTTQMKKAAAEPGMRIAYRAYFGQALNDDTSGADAVLTDISQRTPSFTSQIPLLSQFLAKRNPWKDIATSPPTNSSPELADRDDVGEGSLFSQREQFKYELTLSSASQAPSFPRLNVQLIGADPSLGLKQPLQISAISAVLGQKTSYLLLPTQTVDIKYESQILHDIYREGSTADTGHATLLSQLAKYFEAAGSLPEPKFAPFTTLTIPQNIRPLSNRSKAPDPDHEYVLESATALDVASYRPPFLSKLCLDHVVFMGDDRSEGSRQVLQLVEGPRFSAPLKQKNASRFAGFFNSAYEIARFLGDPALLATRKG